ncbi:DUF58 domain-containing protein [Chloroflexota bacterium]
MTRTGIGFIIAGVVVYLIASQSQVNWLYLFDAIIWSLVLLSAILTHRDLRSLHIEQQVLTVNSTDNNILPGGPVEDEIIDIRITVRNNGFLARHFVSLQVECPFEQPENRVKDFLIATLGSRSSITFSYSASCYCRGYFAYSDIILRSSGLLGMFSRRKVIKIPLNLTIYPAYYRMEGLYTTGEDQAEWGEGISSGVSGQFYSSREYQLGDPLKHIHWRNTARLGQFMIKEFERTSRGSISVIFTVDKDIGTDRETTLEYSIKIAASLARLCADTGRIISVQAGEEYLLNAGWQSSMDFLARLQVEESSFTDGFPVVAGHGQTVIAIVPAIETGLSSILPELVKQVNELKVVLLEGFSENEIPGKVIDQPGLNNLDIYRSSPGNLEEVVNALATSLVSARRAFPEVV